MKIGISLLSQAESQFTGTSRYVTELIREMSFLPDRVELDVLCNQETVGQGKKWGAGNIRVTAARDFELGGSRFERLTSIGGGLVRSGRLSRQFASDIEAVHYPLIIPLPRVRLPTLINHHDLLHREHPELFSRSELVWRRLAYDRGARRATIVLALSQHSRSKLIEHLDLDPNRVIHTPMAVDRERFHPEPEPGEEKRLGSLGLPDRFIFYPASLWPHKSHSELIAAFARLDDRDVQLVLSGATFGQLPTLEREVLRLGLVGRVRHLGFIAEEDLPGVYRRAAALAFPSRYEGFGTPPLEAMACGCPVASSRAASLAEVCGDAALELDPDDVDQMSVALQRITTDEGVRAHLRQKGLLQASRFSWRSSVEALLGAYQLAIRIGRH